MHKEVAIKVDSLTKKYKLYHSQRDRIKELVNPMRKSYHQNHYALKNISLQIKHGEVIGIIGQNGSGKSTLLKILASVVTPTSGTYHCEGRVAALLELGAGFNKELSGIENIRFLCALQGYSKKEIEVLMNGILEFADIGEYADQPVSTYSSGMYVRLAFSISINIDPDILIIDEALSVGDIRFQQKCFRKIREFKDQGKTIIICTHSLSVVKDFCTRALWIREGVIMEEGIPIFVTDCYNRFMTENRVTKLQAKNMQLSQLKNLIKVIDDLPVPYNLISWPDLSICESFGTGDCYIKSATILDVKTNANINLLRGGENIRVLLYLSIHQQINNPRIQLLLNGQFGSTVFKISSHAYAQKLHVEVDKPTIVTIEFVFPKISNGHYSLSLGIVSYEENTELVQHWIHDALFLEVSNPDIKYKMGTQLIVDKIILASHTK